MAEEVRIPFVGDFSELQKGLAELRDLTVQVKEATQANSKAIQTDAQKNVAATDSVNKALEETLAVTSALNKEGLGGFSKGVDGAEKSVDGFSDSTDKATKSTSSLSSNLDDTAKEFGKVKTAAAQAGDTATSSLKKTETAAKTTDRSLTGLGARFRNVFSSVGSFIGNAGRSIASVGANLKTALVDRLRSVSQGFSGVGATALAALGPIGIAVGAVGAGLLAIGGNIDSVGVKFDGFRRTGGIVFDQITGKVREFFNSITEGDGIGAKVFGGLVDAIGFVLTPLRLLISGIGELTGITAALEEANKAGQELAEMYDAIDEAQTNNIRNNAVLEKQINKLNIQLRDRTKTEQERVKIADQIAALEKQRLNNELQGLQLLTRAKKKEADLELKNKGEVNDELARELADAQAAEIRAAQESESLTERTQNRLNAILEQGIEKRKAIRDKQLEYDKKLAALEAELQKQVAEAQAQDADPLKQAQLERQASIVRIETIEKELREVNRLRTGQATLSLEQEEQLTTLRLAADEAYWKRRLEIDRANIAVRLTLIQDTNERERLELEQTLTERAEALRLAGATEQQILQDAANKRTELIRSQGERTIALEQRIAIAEIEQRKRGAEGEEEFERQKQAAILKIKIEAAQKSLTLIGETSSLESQAAKAELQALIASLQGELTKLETQGKGFSIAKLLGITEAEATAIQGTIGQISTAIQQAIAAEQAQVQAQIAATDAIIADRERRSQDLQSRLANEIALAEAGFASNVDLIRQQIAAEDAAAESDKQRRAALVADQQRLARQQLAIDSIIQASALATAAAKLFSAEAPKGIVGVLGAIGVLASMIGAFLSLKARAKSIAAEQFEDGGHVGGRRHSQGGTLIEAERGEFVAKRSATAKWGPVLEGINEGDWTRQRQAALVELLDSANVRLSPDMADQFVVQKEAYVQNEYKAGNARLEKKVGVLTEELRGFRRDSGGRSTTESNDGFTVTRKPGRTTRRKHG